MAVFMLIFRNVDLSVCLSICDSVRHSYRAMIIWVHVCVSRFTFNLYALLYVAPASTCRPISGLLIAVAPRYRYCSGATFTVAVAVAPLLLDESSGDSSAATFLAVFLELLATATFKKEN